MAAKVVSSYQFDEGLSVSWGPGQDFRHCFEIDPRCLREFDRNSPKVLPTVNLRPRSPYHRVYAVDDFLRTLDNLDNGLDAPADGVTRGVYYLRDGSETFVRETTVRIHEMNRGKDLKLFMAEVFKRIPSVSNVKQNGFGWKSDEGADLIISSEFQLAGLSLKLEIVVQIKSYTAKHTDVDAIRQLRNAVEKFDADAAMLVTTGEVTPQLEKAIEDFRNELDVPFELLAGPDVARFVIENAPDLLFKLR